MKFVFLMDPLETVRFVKDTSLMLMVGAYRRKHEIYYLPKGGVTLNAGRIYFNVVKVVPQLVKTKPFLIKERLTLRDDEIDVLFIRTDPPFDYDFLIHSWLLDQAAERIFVINHPNGIRTVNEKIWASQFTAMTPKTFIGRRQEPALKFLNAHRHIIAKPTDGHGGQGVFHIRRDDKNAHVILETITHDWNKDVVLQEYLPKAKYGDKRILLLNGEPLGAVLRVHAEDDHRNNFFAGGKPKPTKITKRDLEIIKTLKPHIQKLGLYFVGIDIIGDKLIEVNVTSPTCLQEMNRLYGVHLEDKVIGFVEKFVGARHALPK